MGLPGARLPTPRPALAAVLLVLAATGLLLGLPAPSAQAAAPGQGPSAASNAGSNAGSDTAGRGALALRAPSAPGHDAPAQTTSEQTAPGQAASGQAAPGRDVPSVPGHDAPTGRVVLVGVDGLMWTDITASRTPTLWKLAGQGGAGAMTVRTTQPYTCPTDGWLTVSAGQRSRLKDADCVLPSNPVLPGAPVPAGSPAPAQGGALAPGWPRIVKDNSDSSYHAKPGLLGETAHRNGLCTTAIGPGAVYGLADRSGRVDHYVAGTDRATQADWSRCPLTAVEIDDVFRAYLTAGVDAKGVQVPVKPADRARAASAADRRVAQVLAGVPAGTTVLLAGMSDNGPKPHLRVALATGPGFSGSSYLYSDATRQKALVTLTDVTSTMMQAVRLTEPSDAVGSPFRTRPTGDKTARKVEILTDEEVAGQAIRRVQGGFLSTLAGVQLVVYVIAGLALRRRWRGPSTRRRILAGTRAVALVGASVPGASFLAGVFPWWKAPHTTPVLVATVLAISVAMAAVVLAGPWRRTVVLPVLIVAGITAATLGLDVMTGSHLQMNSFLGYTAVVAGRFYGFGNQAFALFAAAMVLSAAWLAGFPLRRGHRWWAVAVVAVVGLAAIALDGGPMWGADFGGVLAFVPTFALLGLMVSGRRVSLVKLGLFCVAGAAAVLLLSFLNSRSSHPTHMGKFWNDLVGGHAWSVVSRKLDSMLGSLAFWPVTLLVAAGIVLLYLVLARPSRFRWTTALTSTYARAETMRPALVCALTVGVIGTLANDSGVIILMVVLVLTVPLFIAAAARSLALDDQDRPDAAGEPSTEPTPAKPSKAQG
ncbi:hypothetical protein [Actinomadura rupiterrae]|uniref:hypothetical protein n=1 Tax=Actinomadura rupiterrae TaxID=559627 RepID=UPI0020A54DA2|nr:hypothetical protein [Actinomadura rupiterrae]MCP2338033.1 hypothetical protein [Actinomadura rupiterrae]